jgi:uncharacterized protein YbaR (Trm112 family)
MIKITCPNCQKALTIDETKLPLGREVTFPCPACKTNLLVHRDPEHGVTVTARPAAAASGPAAHEEEHDGFGAKALLVGADHPGIRHAAKLIGHVPVYVATAGEAREYFNQEFPPIVMLHPAQITPPPLEAMAPIVSVTPVDRRKSFYILFSDNLRTLDGNAAFLYGVNLVVAPKDLGAFPQIFKEAWGYHERLYAAMSSVARAAAQTS